MTISTIQDIIADLKTGRMVILVDEEDRENEGDLVLAADFVTPEAINFMATYGRGLICLTLTEARCRQLNLPLMVTANRSPLGTNFTLSIEAASGVTTGISAADRANTIKAAVKAGAKAEDIVQPGHIFPLMAQKGGVLVRAGHTEAGCDLASMAGLTAASVICEILKEDGSMARLPDLMVFAEKHQLKIGTIADLIHYRSLNESLITRVAERTIQTIHGDFLLVAYRDETVDTVHLALTKGEIKPDSETLVRVHEPVSVIDLLDIHDDTHSWNIHEAMCMVAEAGTGVIVLLRGKENSDKLIERVQLHESDFSGRNKSDLRDHGIGAQILKDLNVGKMRLLATPRKMPSVTGFGLEVTSYVDASDHNR
ncbi:MAG TPA: bifunctional 3,4-dihydroxy-2-butanone-4-phosphate synthase/GTP cyclohydrolase II [Nitrosomonas sp.]|uniref:bifunctional 3,4-dihydroxy-2-butanone-4-phosphate synthase/GTP cyclohydrolase II n=1 Tax=Nitrosomonas sp. TaxID=42353 RepID=UPI000E9B15A2|nr:bifunctional 3,4-dihydroxy-2-butanone-4-phosphate synthase/GTP cyclohydrolase II [Nitrosomonas sp.]GJL75847.1 MAG: 3,4-dihydroxy-2-butanone-4-phosphate synthase [Nitrosomonas sp.]HBV20852.1 3,4-dihydroxy-2-butanone-4-phosphate synthase [Nitrosomonas sp.]HNP25122.1 bifunctional 3,4-dihydroxy-2-butanone-4-phosphate synthase/GTP cyclohydrolase II [Nitrosomonas sp.]